MSRSSIDQTQLYLCFYNAMTYTVVSDCCWQFIIQDVDSGIVSNTGVYKRSQTQ